MNKAEDKRWRRASPLAAIYYLGVILKAVAKNAFQSLAPLAAAVVALQGNLTIRIVYAVVIFTTFVVLAAIARYWFFRFRIGTDAVLIREGVFRKLQTDIKFDRIQGINTQQNVVYRYFGLVTVSFDTAGSAGEEGRLPAVGLALAESLKARIRREKPAMLVDEAVEAPAARQLLALGNSDIIRIGLSDSRALFLLLLIGPLAERMEDGLADFIEQNEILAVLRDVDFSLLGALALVVAMITVVLLMLAVSSVIAAFLRYYRFTLAVDDDVLRSHGGLLTRHEHSVNIAKVQSLAAIQGPLLRLMGRFRLQARQASSGKASRGSKFVIPLTNPVALAGISAEILGAEFPAVDLHPSSPQFQPIDRRYIRSRILAFGVIPAVSIFALLLYPLGWYALVFLAWIPAAALAFVLLFRRYGYFFDHDGLVMRDGFLGYRVIAFLHRKVQRVSIVQSVTQKRRGLANLRFDLASGSVLIPYISLDAATRLSDFVLYRVESSDRKWH